MQPLYDFEGTLRSDDIDGFGASGVVGEEAAPCGMGVAGAAEAPCGIAGAGAAESSRELDEPEAMRTPARIAAVG